MPTIRDNLEAVLRRLRERQAADGARRRRGMTLMEVMIVIAIILLLMGALAFGLTELFGEAQGDTARLMIGKIDQKVKIYKIKKKSLPDGIDDLYKTESVPVDPWGNPFIFRKGGKNGYDIISYGADGREGGTGADEDIKLSDMGG